jgi:hypothetical protein
LFAANRLLIQALSQVQEQSAQLGDCGERVDALELQLLHTERKLKLAEAELAKIRTANVS